MHRNQIRSAVCLTSCISPNGLVATGVCYKTSVLGGEQFTVVFELVKRKAEIAIPENLGMMALFFNAAFFFFFWLHTLLEGNIFSPGVELY